MDDDILRTMEAYLSYKLTKWAFGSGELKMDNKKYSCNYPEIWTARFYHRVTHPKDADKWQTEHLIKLLLQELSDQGLYCLPFCQYPFNTLLYGKTTHLNFKIIIITILKVDGIKPDNLCDIMLDKVYDIMLDTVHALFFFVLRLNIPVNNFSVMSGRSQRFLGN